MLFSFISFRFPYFLSFFRSVSSENSNHTYLWILKKFEFLFDSTRPPHGRQFHHQIRLLPQDVRLLLVPVKALAAELQVEVPQDLGEDEAHFCVRETKKK